MEEETEEDKMYELEYCCSDNVRSLLVDDLKVVV